MASTDDQPNVSSRTSNSLAPGAWGQPITAERQSELQALLDAWSASGDVEEGSKGTTGPFTGIKLSGADATWLALRSRTGQYGLMSDLHLEGADLSDANLIGAVLRAAHLEGANLSHANLKGATLPEVRLDGAKLSGATFTQADLSRAHLEGANVQEAHLDNANLTAASLAQADLSRAQLEGANLQGARLERANLQGANLEGAYLQGAHLEGADLSAASLARADLSRANLERANLTRARLEGAYLMSTSLKEADLRASLMDSTVLVGTVLAGALLADVRWGTTNIGGVDWSGMRILGDELLARSTKTQDGKTKSREQRVEEFAAAARAYQGLIPLLRSRAVKFLADRFAYRALLLDRRVDRLESDWFAWLGSLLLDLVAGYGYKPIRLILSYVILIEAFALAYVFATALGFSRAAPISWGESFLFSVQVVLGHGVPDGSVTLSDPLVTIADVEVLVSILYGYIFANVVTKRLFGTQS